VAAAARKDAALTAAVSLLPFLTGRLLSTTFLYFENFWRNSILRDLVILRQYLRGLHLAQVLDRNVAIHTREGCCRHLSARFSANVLIWDGGHRGTARQNLRPKTSFPYAQVRQ